MAKEPNKSAVNRDPNSGKFLPGNCANPNGRPKKDCSLTSLLKVELDKICPADKEKRTWRELLVLAWLKGCVTPGRGQGVLLKELLDRVEGKILQPIGGEGGQPIRTESTVYQIVTPATKELIERIRNGEREPQANNDIPSKP